MFSHSFHGPPLMGNCMKGEKYTVHIRQQQEAKTDKESADKGNGMYVIID
jgi:hypothetical protein